MSTYPTFSFGFFTVNNRSVKTSARKPRAFSRAQLFTRLHVYAFAPFLPRPFFRYALLYPIFFIKSSNCRPRRPFSKKIIKISFPILTKPKKRGIIIYRSRFFALNSPNAPFIPITIYSVILSAGLWFPVFIKCDNRVL